MPCRDWDDTPAVNTRLEKENDKLTQFLGTVLSTLESENELDHFAELFDYKEGGITREELFAWWKAHKEEDRRRREQVRKAQEVAERRKVALAKLTTEERKLLGVK